MNNNYTVLHCHTEQSLLDSCTNYKLYVDMAKSLSQTAIAFTEHSNIYNWIDKKMYCEKEEYVCECGKIFNKHVEVCDECNSTNITQTIKPIKYIHGVEAYLTYNHKDKVRDNYHTILLSKNYDGFMELNRLIDKSTEDSHFYYKPRISFDEFLNISDNIIKISACLASPLRRFPKAIEDLEDKDIAEKYYERLLKHYDYYEIQHHNCDEQIEYNRYLYSMSKKYNKPLIVGTDTHSLNKYKAECRSVLQMAKKIMYDTEDEFDLTYKSYDEIVQMFKKQDSIPMEEVLLALENTNKVADSVEDFELDISFKYPKTYDNEEDVLIQTIKEKYQYKLQNGIIKENPKYIENIKEEMRVFKKIGMIGFILFMSELMTWCRNNDIPTSPCRGSVGGSTIAYITDIIDVDPIVWGTVFSRFANEDRMEIGDIDVDISPDQRELVYQYIIDRFGADYTSYILASGTLAGKSVIDEVGRALCTKWIKDKGNNGGKNPYSLSKIASIKQEFEKNPEETKKKYPDIFYYFDGLVGTVVSQSVHPAGIIASPVNLVENYGTFWSKGKRILSINMEEVHEVSLVKYDILGLKNIQIIRDTCKMAGIPYPLSHEINWEDKNVWDSMLISPVGIFQFESSFAFESLRRYKPSKINHMSLVNAAIRPSGASYRNRLLNHEINKNPSAEIDELLKDNGNYLVFQEDIIKFLQQICGLSGSDADNVRRAIGRKDEERLQKALPQILKGYCDVSSQPRDVAEQEAKTFLKIIEDSSSYMFGLNHSTGYSMVGYLCAYFRHYYRYEFIASLLNNSETELDTANGISLATKLNITISQPKFRYSKSDYMFDKENKIIYKGLSSIKYLSKNCAEEMYLLKDNEYNTFTDLLFDLKSTCIDARQLDILIKLEFFSEFGTIKELLNMVSMYDFFKSGEAKEIRVAKVSEFEYLEKIVSDNAELTKSGITYKNLNMKNILSECSEYIKSLKLPDVNIKSKIEWQKEFMGYVSFQSNKESDRYRLIALDVVPLLTRDKSKIYSYLIKAMSIGNGRTQELKIWTKIFDKEPIQQYDIIQTDRNSYYPEYYNGVKSWRLNTYKIDN